MFYSNASASLRDGDTCALRELMVDGASAGVMLLPHNTEADCWEEYARSAALVVQVEKSGLCTFSLCYTPRCHNANGEMNQCMVRQLEIIRLK